MAQFATVSALNGQVLVLPLSEGPRLVEVGDLVQVGDTIRPAPGASVVLQTDDGLSLSVSGNQALVFGADAPVPSDPAAEAAVQTVIDALDRGQSLDQLDTPAAGLAGGSGGEGSSFVRLLRISEGVTPLSYEFGVHTPGHIAEPQLHAVSGGGDSSPPPPPPPPPPGDLHPDAVNDFGQASVVVERTQGEFNGDAKVVGAADNQAFLTHLNHVDNQATWLLSDASFKNQLNGFEGGFTIEDKGAGSDPAFVATPQFTAHAGEVFSFTADTHLASDAHHGTADTFTAGVYHLGASGWEAQAGAEFTVAADGSYHYTFPDDGEYRVTFTVDDNTAGGDKPTATIDIQSDSYFYTGDGENVTVTDASGTILVNDTMGDGTNVFTFAGGVVNPDGTTTVEGDHGTLTVDANGGYTYTPHVDGTGGTDAFTYTLADADTPSPDSDQAVLSITVDYQVVSPAAQVGADSLALSAAPTVIDSTDVLDAASAAAPLLDDGSGTQAATDGVAVFDVLAANLNGTVDESVKRMVRDSGNSKNP